MLCAVWDPAKADGGWDVRRVKKKKEIQTFVFLRES